MIGLERCDKNMCRSREGTGFLTPPPPLENHKALGFLSNTGQEPLENHKATKTVFNVEPMLH